MSFKPAVNRSLLLLLSGLFWATAGIVLLRFALHWMQPRTPLEIVLLTGAGVSLSLVFTWIGFSRIVSRNIDRINRLPQWACLFAFQAWRSYLLIAVMISMGIFLRQTHFVPRLLMVAGYLGLGLSLLWGSGRYLMKWWALK